MTNDETGRWLSPSAAAAYIDVRVDALPRLVRAGRIPPPTYTLGQRSPRYDRLTLDKALSGKQSEAETNSMSRAINESIKKWASARRPD
jgi:hypothetical protein